MRNNIKRKENMRGKLTQERKISCNGERKRYQVTNKVKQMKYLHHDNYVKIILEFY